PPQSARLFPPMGNHQTTSNRAPSEEPTPNKEEADTDCIVSPSRVFSPAKPSESLTRRLNNGGASDDGDRAERKKKKPAKPREKNTTGRKSVKQVNSSGRSSKSTTSKSSSRGKTTKKDEQLDPVEQEFRRAFRGEGREKARFISSAQESADVPTITGGTVKFETTQTAVNVLIPHYRTYKKKNRSKHDPWRRYGALKKLHQIGGWAFNQKDLKQPQDSRRTRRGVDKNRIKYYEIKKGEPFYTPPPINQPITK
ncbi:hypothetical protein PENTCL1PPCAC_18376, partial [Pristionchus entomophagus]